MGWLKEALGLEQTPSPVLSVNDENFQREVVESKLPVLLDVWSPTCVPCKQLEPIVIDLARRYQGRLKVAEISTETGARVLSRLGVRGTPTVLYFDRGQIVERVVGLRGSLYHSEFIENELLDGADEVGTEVGEVGTEVGDEVGTEVGERETGQVLAATGTDDVAAPATGGRQTRNRRKRRKKGRGRR